MQLHTHIHADAQRGQYALGLIWELCICSWRVLVRSHTHTWTPQQASVDALYGLVSLHNSGSAEHLLLSCRSSSTIWTKQQALTLVWCHSFFLTIPRCTASEHCVCLARHTGCQNSLGPNKALKDNRRLGVYCHINICWLGLLLRSSPAAARASLRRF